MLFETNEQEAGRVVRADAPMPSAATATSEVPSKPAATTMPGPFHMAGSLCVVIAVIFIAAFVLRRMQGLRGANRGEVMLKGGLQVGARERVLLIEAQGRRVLVGVAPGSVRALHVFEAGEVVSPAEALPMPPAGFAEKLTMLLRSDA